MYTRVMMRNMRSIVPERLAHSTAIGTSTGWDMTILNSSSLCSITGFTTRPYGENFSITIEATTGNLYLCPESTVLPTSTNSFLLAEGSLLDLRIKDHLALVGDSTTAKYQAIVWE